MRRRSGVVIRRTRWIGDGFRDEHWILRKFVAGWQRNLPHVVFVAGSVAEPITRHELDPRRGEHVQGCRRRKCVARQELTTDNARIWFHDPRFWIGPGEFD